MSFEKKLNQQFALLQHARINISNMFGLKCPKSHHIVMEGQNEKWMFLNNELYLNMKAPYVDYLNDENLEDKGLLVNYNKCVGTKWLFDYITPSGEHEIIILKSCDQLTHDDIKFLQRKNIMNIIKLEKNKIEQFKSQLDECNKKIKMNEENDNKELLLEIKDLRANMLYVEKHIRSLKKDMYD